MGVPDEVLPLGHSFDEYSRIFRLEESDRRKRILGVGDGPASFTAEASRRGWRVTSIDPIYRFSAGEIRRRYGGLIDTVVKTISDTPQDWAWSYHKNPGDLRAHMVGVTREFLRDLAAERRDGRYVAGALPALPFSEGAFDLALCAHLLFLYSDVFDLDFHRRSICEMLRVAGEVRLFPLLTLDLSRSPHLEPLISDLQDRGFLVTVRKVDYELHKGGNEVLVIRRGNAG